MFRYSMWMATAVWLLARLVGLADLWLHSTSFTLRSNITLPDSSPGSTPMWGVSLNTSICDDMKTKYKDEIPNEPVELGCLLPYEYFVFSEDWGHAMGFEAMTNTTDAAFHVGTVEGDIAFAFPGPKVVDMRSKNFLIPTFAARASCGLLNGVCKQNANETLDCTSAGYPNFPYYRPDYNGVPTTRIVNRVLGVVGQDIVGLEVGSAESMRAPSNPVKMAIQLQWENLEQGNGTGIQAQSATEIITSVGDLAVDPYHPTLYAGCSLTFLDAFVQWNSTKQDWQLLNATESSPDVTAALWQPIVWQYGTERLASNLMYTARKDTKEEVMRALGQNLAALTLATAAGFYRPHEAYNITKTQRVLVSAYPTLPIMTLLILLCVYASLTLAIFLSSYWTPDEAIIVPVTDYELQDEEMEPSTVTLAQRWLTHPLPLVGSSFSRQDGQDGVRSAAYSAVNAAYDGDEGYTRLTIGLAGDRFGITPWGQR